MIKIDADKCIGCLRCTRACIFTIIEARGGRPVVLEDKLGCARCMHCGLVCPEGAISYNGEPMMVSEDKPLVSNMFRDELESFLLTRRSYRDFRPEPVEDELIRRALELTAWAPSAKNQHPTKYIVVSGREKVEKMMDVIVSYLQESGENPEVLSELARGNNMVLAKAPNLILAYAPDKAVNAPVDTALALNYAELLLQSRGVGTCWAGYLTRMLNKIPGLQEMFPLPEGCSFYACLLVGWPTEDYLYVPKRVKQADIVWK